MADTPVKIADVIVPERFAPYVSEAATRTNAFFQSGVLTPVSDLTFGDAGGTQVNMPFWKALGERAQLLSDSANLEIRKITAGQDVAVLHARALVYGAADLASDLAGDDPMAVVGDGIGENWSYEQNMIIFNTLKGAMGALAAEGTPVNSVNISVASGAAAYIDGESFIDAAQQMGDMKDRIQAVGMHSATNAWLAKQGLIDVFRDADGLVQYETFMQKRVITDDAFAPTTGVYDTYLFGPGALGFGEGSPKVPVETERNALVNGGQEYLVSRRHIVIHPRGIKWIGTPAGLTPTDDELATAANWARVYQPKNIRLVRLRHKIG